MRRFLTITLATIISSLSLMAPQANARLNIDCSPVTFSVTAVNNQLAHVNAEYCVPEWNPHPVLQILVHGGTYNHDYWDWTQFNGQYSYVYKAVATGYATLAIDRIGDGASTRPSLSTDDTYSVQINTLHQVIMAAKKGFLGHHFNSVELIGHSYGSLYVEGDVALHPADAKAVILTGSGHATTAVIGSISKTETYPANNLNRFKTLDNGYLTSSPGTRADLVYDPTKADPRVIKFDEQTEDVLALGEILTRPANQGALSAQIKVPVFLMDGNTDNHYCGPDVDNCSSQQAFYKSESPYFHTDLTTLLVNSGHDIQLSFVSSYADSRMLLWSLQKMGLFAS